MRQIAHWIITLLLTLPLAAGAQVTNKDHITLHLKDVTVVELLHELHDITGLTFNYGDEIAKSNVHFNVNVKEEPLDVVLREMLLPNGFVYNIDGNVVTINPVDYSMGNGVRIFVVNGHVSEASSGEPIVGATVQVEGTKIATITDFNGNFSINLPDLLHPMLNVSYIGMVSQRVNVKNKHRVMISMQDDKATLDEVVVTGYQRIRKADMVGSNSMIRGKDLDMLGTKSLEQMLQGKLAGTVVTNTSGVVGERQKVRVRGTSTLLGSQEPVWVVDGVIQTDPLPFKTQELNSLGDISQDNMDMIRNFVGSSISWLNPSDIESVTVLKDASATVLYGVKAANGVIVITTKRGTKGRMSVGYNGGFSIGERVRYSQLNLMNSRERNDVSREIYERRLVSSRALEPIGYEGLLSKYLNKEISYAEFQQEARRLDTVNTDWLGILFRNSFSNNHSVSLSGGTDKINYYASLYANYNNGTQKGNNSDRYGASLRLDTYLAKNIEVSVDLGGSFAKTNSYYNVNPYSYATQTSRVIPCYNEDGSLYYYPNGTQYSYLYNVLNERDNSGNVNEQRSFNVSAHLQWDLLKGLRFESTLGLSTSNVTGHTWASERTYAMTAIRGYEYGAYTPNDAGYKASPLPHGGQYNYAENHALTYSWTNQVGYNTVLGKDHRLSFLVGMEIRSEKYDGNGYTRFGYMPDRGETFTQPPLTYTTSTGTYSNTRIYNAMTNTITDRKTNYVGYYGSASYSYQERYTATASVRADASNKFGQDTRNRFLPVWSMGVRWNAVNEPWMQRQRIFSELDLRLTYGWQGNVAENYGPDLIAQIPSNPIDNRTGEYILKIRSLAYPDLRWEKTETWNLGLDLGFWHNRIQFSFEYYHKFTKDMITEKTVPEEYGVDTTPINGGQMKNSGLEFTLSTTLIQTKKFNWTLSLNSAKNWNSVESTVNENHNWRTAVSGALNKKGYPVQSIWAFKFKGINQTNGDPEFEVPTSDENPDAVTDATAYMKWMGSLEPSFTGGLSTSFRYTNWVLSASFNLNLGDKRFMAAMFNEDMISDTPSAYSNLPKDFVNHWRKAGDQTDVPGIPSYDLRQRRVELPDGNGEYSYRMYNYSDIRVVSADYFRCTNIGLNYIFPQTMIHRIGLTNLSVAFNVTNPFIIKSKSFKGLDPEVATGSQPQTRSYAFQLNFTL